MTLFEHPQQDEQHQEETTHGDRIAPTSSGRPAVSVAGGVPG